ncbi:MAG TPA: SagB family peptide dehydrogenase, partial [Chthoniobacterales bacterium]|nr:SagB family peptide dehydrogenase [Chthoniobacterales bacterium]
CLFLCWLGGRLVFHNFARRLTVSARPVTCEVLDFFDDWRTSQDAIARFGDYTPRSVRSTLSQLVEQGLLVMKNSPEAGQDSRIAKEWSDWLPAGSFHFSTKDARYVRDNWSFNRLRSLLPKTPQPKIFKTVRGVKKLLPSSTFPDSEFIEALMARKTHREFSKEKVTVENVSDLLSLVWGVTAYLHSPMFGRLLHKTSPSGGARHPGEVYLMALRVKGLKPGLYHYHPARHQLTTITTNITRNTAWRYCAYQGYVRNAAALFLMTAVFPRAMWKYRHARAYRVVLLDAGHLCQTFCLVATWLGLAPFCTAALKDTLIEKDLRIDGIRESILYVAGVGLPTTS